jgi:hypothetical protein
VRFQEVGRHHDVSPAFRTQPLHSSYLIAKANFVACHQFSFPERIDMLKAAEPGATFLLNGTALTRQTKFGTTCHAPYSGRFLEPKPEILRYRWL